MLTRRSFFGALAGSAAVASTAIAASSPERKVPGWVIRWSGWREPANQFVKLGFWVARREGSALSESKGYYSTTLGVVGECGDLYVLDTTLHDRSAPIVPTEPDIKFEAAKAWAHKRLIEKLESL